MAKLRRFIAFLMVAAMVAGAFVALTPSALAAVDGTMFYSEDYSGTAADYWIEISNTGTELPATYYSEHQITYSFNMYGDSFTEVTIGAAGAIRMGYQTIVTGNTNYPSTSSSHTYEIAIFQDYLDVSLSYSHLYYEVQGSKLIVQWQNVVYRYSSSYGYGDYTFQAILDNDDGSIRFNYLGMFPDIYTNGEFRDSATVGLNKGYDGEYEEYYYDSSYSTVGYEGIRPVSGTTILYYLEEVEEGVYLDGLTEADEGTTETYYGTSAGYGIATSGGYTIDDTLFQMFIDASGGTALIDSSSDDGYGSFELPFDFKFFGNQYYAGREVYACANGYMDFGDPNTDHTDYSNDNIPSTTDPDNYVAPFWDDLYIRGEDYGGTPALIGGATINPGADYNSNMYETLSLTTLIDGDMTITFQNDIETGWDGWHVKVDGTLVTPVGGYDDLTIVGLSNEPGNTGHDSAPRTQTWDLSTYIGGTHTIEIIFGSDSSVTYPGPIIDEVTIGTTVHPFDTTLAPWTGTSGWGIQAPTPAVPGIDSILYYDVGVAGGHAYFVVEWLNVYDLGYTTNPGTFEAVFWDDNTIDLRYLEVNMGSATGCAYGVSATVGLENQDGSEGAKYSYNQAILVNGMNIRFTWSDYAGGGYQWLVDGIVVDSGPVWEDPFYSSIDVLLADGPATVIIEFVATWDGYPIDGADLEVTVYNLPPEVSIDQGSTETMDLGDTLLIDGDINDVPADVITWWEEMTPGTSGIDWVLIPTAPDSTTDEFGYDFIPILAGIYTFTIYAEDDDGASDQASCVITVEIPDDALEITEIFIKPKNTQAGGMTMIYVDVFNTLPGDRVVGGPHWHQVAGGSWWCGDDTLGTHGPDWLDALEFEVTLGAGELFTVIHEAICFHPWDGGNLQIWDGTSWQLVYPTSGFGYDATSVSGLDSPYADAPGWCDSGGVVTSNFDLGAGTHLVRFVFGSTSVVHYEGWYIHTVMAGATDITDTGVPKDLTAGGTTEPIPVPPIQVPLDESDLVLTLPDGWHMLSIDGPDGYIAGQTTKTFVVAVSIPPGTEVGDYGIDVSLPYTVEPEENHWHWVGDAFWCGDDVLGTYDDNYLDELNLWDVYVDADILMLDYYIEAENGWDGGNVQISTDDGTTWSLLTPVDGYDDTSIYGLDSPTTDAAGFTSSSGYSAFAYFDISAYADMTIDIRFVFGSDSSVHGYDGWFIYSVQLAEATPIGGTGTAYLLEDFTMPLVHPWWTNGGSWVIDTGSSNAGGEPPEAECSWLNVYDNIDNYLYCDPVDTSSASSLQLTFKHMHDMYSVSTPPYTIRVETRADSTDPWTIRYFQNVTSDTPAEQLSFDITDDIGPGTQVQFVWNGNDYWDLNYWWVDDVWLATPDYSPPTVIYNPIRDITGDMIEPGIKITVVEKMKGNDLAFYRHCQTAMRDLVMLDLNLENGMEDDGSQAAALDAYRGPNTQLAHNIAASANAKGENYGYWTGEGGYDYFFNPGKNGNGMAGLTGKEAMD